MLGLWGGLLDLVYPRVCLVCHEETDAGPARHLCWECARKIRYQSHEAYCSRCGRDIPGPHADAFVCAACRAHPPGFDLARSAAHFEGPARDLVHALKYHHASYVVPDLADLLEACHSRHYAAEPVDLICPVPLHPARLREREYNQSALLGQELARRTGIPCIPDLLVRTRDTPTQTHLGADARRANVRGAFEVHSVLSDWVEGRTVLLLDDVMTTGATLSEASHALRAAGAVRILALTVARD